MAWVAGLARQRLQPVDIILCLPARRVRGVLGALVQRASIRAPLIRAPVRSRAPPVEVVHLDALLSTPPPAQVEAEVRAPGPVVQLVAQEAEACRIRVRKLRFEKLLLR